MEERHEVNDIQPEGVDILGLASDILKRLRELWWICLIIVLVCTARGVIKEKKAYRPMYEASASFAVYAGSDNNTISNYYNKVSAKQLSATFPYILTSGALNKIVAADLGVSAIPGVVSANMLGETNLFQIQVISSDPQSAYDVLQSVIENYPEVARYVIGDTKLKLIDETGVPTAPLNTPQYKKRAVKGAGMGFTLCVLLLAAAEMTRTTVKKREDLKKFLNVKYLTGIPQVRFKKRSDESINQLLRDNPSTPDVYNDALDTAAIGIERAMKEKEMKSLLVTSALAGEGKTTTACNLALTLSEHGYKVLLIDGDLRNPSVADALNLGEQKYGMKDVLSGLKKAQDVICRYGETNLFVLPGGEPLAKVSMLYSNSRMGLLMKKYAEEMDFVIVDTPPCAVMNDAALIARNVEAGLLVIRRDYARREKILTGAEIIAQSGNTLLGCVINGEEYGYSRYGYGYGKYGYGRYGYGRYGYGKYGYGKAKNTEE